MKKRALVSACISAMTLAMTTCAFPTCTVSNFTGDDLSQESMIDLQAPVFQTGGTARQSQDLWIQGWHWIYIYIIYIYYIYIYYIYIYVGRNWWEGQKCPLTQGNSAADLGYHALETLRISSDQLQRLAMTIARQSRQEQQWGQATLELGKTLRHYTPSCPRGSCMDIALKQSSVHHSEGGHCSQTNAVAFFKFWIEPKFLQVQLLACSTAQVVQTYILYRPYMPYIQHIPYIPYIPYIRYITYIHANNKLHYTTIHYSTLHYTTLHYITLHTYIQPYIGT